MPHPASQCGAPLSYVKAPLPKQEHICKLYMSRSFIHVLCDLLKRIKGILFADSFHTTIAVGYCCYC